MGFCLGTSLDDLRDAKTRLDAAGVKCTPMAHGVTRSLHGKDPDGNGVELYVDVSEDSRADPQSIATAELLEL